MDVLPYGAVVLLDVAWTGAQRALVELVYRAWHPDPMGQVFRWPTFGYVDLEMRRRHGVDAAEVLASFPTVGEASTGPWYGHVSYNRLSSGYPEDEVRLTVAGLARVADPGGDPTGPDPAGFFLDLLTQAGRQLLHAQPDPYRAEPVLITNASFAEANVAVSPGVGLAMYDLVKSEPYPVTGLAQRGCDGDGSWRIQVHSRALAFADGVILSEYLSRIERELRVQPRVEAVLPVSSTGRSVSVPGGQGTQVGDGGTQINNFYGQEPQRSPISAPGRTRADWLDLLHAAADGVLDLDVLDPSQAVDGATEWIQDTFRTRQEKILGACADVVRLVVSSVRTGDPQITSLWVDLVPELTPNVNRSGITSLLNLYRAGGVMTFHAGGMASCVMREDALTGLLLGPQIQVNDPVRGQGPAAVVLEAGLVYPGGWPSQQLHDYLVPLLAEPVGVRRAEQAWERWTYLLSVAGTDMRRREGRMRPEWPYLRVADRHDRLRSVGVAAAEGIRREIALAGEASALLGAGFCDGQAGAFVAAADDFEQAYTTWADQQDWRALPPGSGVLPTGPHYPGIRETWT